MIITALLSLLLLQSADEDKARVRVAAEYYAMWNGDWPAKIDDLVTKPAKCKFWPEGGFLDKAPDLKFSIEGYVKRSETIDGDDPKLLTTRYRLAQIAAVLKVRGKVPANLDGFPKDGWGNSFTLVTGDGGYKIVSPGHGSPVPPAPITDELRAKVAALVAALSDESLDRRNGAAAELFALGEATLPLLADAEAKAKDEETKAQLQAVTAKHKQAIEDRKLPALEVAACFFPKAEADKRNEKYAVAYFKTLATAQADFRSNDRDNNRINDFWTADVYSLSEMVPLTMDGEIDPAPVAGNSIRLIEKKLAMADAFPLVAKQSFTKAPAIPTPAMGYLFLSGRKVRTGGSVASYRIDTGIWKRPWHHLDQFAFVAFPASYGVTGTMTFLITQDNTIFKKDTGGDPLFTIPFNPSQDGWKKLD